MTAMSLFKVARRQSQHETSGGSNPGLGARGLEPFVDFCGRGKRALALGPGLELLKVLTGGSINYIFQE
jgi:hypothetical protein